MHEKSLDKIKFYYLEKGNLKIDEAYFVLIGKSSKNAKRIGEIRFQPIKIPYIIIQLIVYGVFLFYGVRFMKKSGS